MVSENGGSKKKILNPSVGAKSSIPLFISFSIRKHLESKENLVKFLINILTASELFSTKVVFIAPLEMHSMPKEPDPE